MIDNYSEILFNEDTHTYTNIDNVQYISCTQFIDQFKKKYDRDFWCMFTALKENNYNVKPFLEERKIAINGYKYKVDDIKKDTIYQHLYTITDAKWKILNEESCLRGNNTHNYLENSINKSKGDLLGKTNELIRPVHLKGELKTPQDLDITDLQNKYPFIYNRLKQYLHRDTTIFAEKRVHLDNYRIAGMIDVPIFSNNSNSFCIMDWKTNKDEFNEYAGYYKKRKVGNQWIKTAQFVLTGERFINPISHLEASKLNLYTLQLSLYAFILEEWGYKLANNGLEIVHLRPGLEPKLIKINYLKKEIQVMLNHRLKQL